jgi:hypothetical protein
MALTRPRSPSRRSLIGLGLKRNAAEVSSQVGYTINGSRLNRDSNEARRIAANIAKLPGRRCGKVTTATASPEPGGAAGAAVRLFF